MLRTLIIYVSFFSITALFGQDYEFGEVSKAELSEKKYDKYPEANAAVLYKNHDTYFNYGGSGVEVVTIIHERIKIYNKDGFDYATQEVNLFKSGNSGERISKIEGFTYNLENGEIVTSELDKNQIFENEFSYNYDQVKFTMPNVKEGSVIEYTYKTTSPYYYYIDELVFQYDIPIKKIDASVRTPQVLTFKNTSKGYLSFYPTRTSKKDHRLGLNVDIDTYSLTDVPAISVEQYAGNINNYTAGIMLEFVAENFPGRSNYQRATNWKQVASTIGTSSDYKKELDKTNSFDDEVDAVIAKSITNLEKMEALFNYIKKEIKWNGNDGKYFQNGIKKALKEHLGNAADINLSLVAMLRYAGLKANPVVISTKENGIPLFPTVDRLNYVLAHVEINEESYFLDATDAFSDINLMPSKDYNWQGIMVDNNNKKWELVTIKEPKPAVSQHQLIAKVSSDGIVEGTLKSRYSNHYAYTIKANYKNEVEENYISQREATLGNIEISNYSIKNIDKAKGKVSESFNFYSENGAEIIAEDIYLDPFALFKYEENPFKLEKRLYPIDFEYPRKDQYIITYEIPDGYAVKTITEPIKIVTPNNEAELVFKADTVGNRIQVSIAVNINKAIISSDNYIYIKEFYNQLISKSKEKIVLIKV